MKYNFTEHDMNQLTTSQKETRKLLENIYGKILEEHFTHTGELIVKLPPLIPNLYEYETNLINRWGKVTTERLFKNGEEVFTTYI